MEWKNLRVLFIGGLYNGNNFEKYIDKIFTKKRIKVLYTNMRELTEYKINNNDIIIAYSYGIQYLWKYESKLKDKKVILLCPLLNNSKLKDSYIKVLSKIATKNIGISLGCKILGANEKTVKGWAEDVKHWLKKYGTELKPIEKIKTKRNWLVFDSEKRPVSQTQNINGYVTDDNGNKTGHVLNYDNNLLFLDKYLIEKGGENNDSTRVRKSK